MARAVFARGSSAAAAGVRKGKSRLKTRDQDRRIVYNTVRSSKSLESVMAKAHHHHHHHPDLCPWYGHLHLRRSSTILYVVPYTVVLYDHGTLEYIIQ